MRERVSLRQREPPGQVPQDMMSSCVHRIAKRQGWLEWSEQEGTEVIEMRQRKDRLHRGMGTTLAIAHHNLESTKQCTHIITLSNLSKN